eukprot:377740-Hanusia_phi.AAC.1
MRLSVIVLLAWVSSHLPLSTSSECGYLHGSYTGGSFIHGSISWRRVSTYTVEFEVISTWRRKFPWPCSRQRFNGSDGWPAVGDTVLTTGMGYNESASQGEALGIGWEPGDGT